jgi:hypothetical protein
MNDDTRDRPIATRAEFQAALREVFADLARTGCREVWLCDSDFAEWPLNEREVVEHLTQWAYAHRKLTVIARHFNTVAQRHPRWVAWRRQWSHVVECLACEDEETPVPTVLLAGGLSVVRLADPLRYRGVLSFHASELQQQRELIDAVSQRAVPSFPATVTGL